MFVVINSIIIPVVVIRLQLLSFIILHSQVYNKYFLVSFSFGLDDCDASNVKNVFPAYFGECPAIFATNLCNLMFMKCYLSTYLFIR